MKEKITYEEYLNTFEKDKNGKYMHLIIPETELSAEINLIGKTDAEFTLDEIIKMKQFASRLFALVDKKTIK